MSGKVGRKVSGEVGEKVSVKVSAREDGGWRGVTFCSFVRGLTKGKDNVFPVTN